VKLDVSVALIGQPGGMQLRKDVATLLLLVLIAVAVDIDNTDIERVCES
jgi:hypothetical protein